MLTGCRKSEILTLKWDDVDRTAGELRLRDGKRGPRMVPLTPPVQKVLDGIERIEGNPWVIRSKKPGACLPDLTYYWNRIQARAGLQGVRIHDLRHSQRRVQPRRERARSPNPAGSSASAIPDDRAPGRAEYRSGATTVRLTERCWL